MEALGIPVEGWHDEAAPAQFEINLDPTDPITACDHVVRAKQVMREVAMEQGRAVTFMAKPSAEYGNGLHLHHSLTRDGEPPGSARMGHTVQRLVHAVVPFEKRRFLLWELME